MFLGGWAKNTDIFMDSDDAGEPVSALGHPRLKDILTHL